MKDKQIDAVVQAKKALDEVYEAWVCYLTTDEELATAVAQLHQATKGAE